MVDKSVVFFLASFMVRRSSAASLFLSMRSVGVAVRDIERGITVEGEHGTATAFDEMEIDWEGSAWTCKLCSSSPWEEAACGCSEEKDAVGIFVDEDEVAAGGGETSVVDKVVA